MLAICFEESFSSCCTPNRKSGAGVPCFGKSAHERGQALCVIESGNAFQRWLDRLAVPSCRPGRCSCRRHSSRRTFSAAESWGPWRPRPVPARAGIDCAPEQREDRAQRTWSAGNRIVLDPVAAGVLVEVGARIGRFIDRREVEAFGCGRRGRLRFVTLRSCGSLRNEAGRISKDAKRNNFIWVPLSPLGGPELGRPTCSGRADGKSNVAHVEKLRRPLDTRAA